MSVISNFVNSNPTLFADVKQNTYPAQTFASDYAEATQTQSDVAVGAKEKKTKREIQQDATNEEIKAFFESMKKAGGADKYLQKMNQAKIEELIEKKKEELREAYGLNSKPPLSKEDTAKALSAIEEALASYKKELIEEMKEKSKQEKVAQANNTNMPSVATTKPKITSLADLLSVI